MEEEKEMIRAALYLRYSSDRQDDASIETQRAECSRKAEALGAVVAVEFIDEAKSGRVDDRESFQRMISAARHKPKPFDLVIVRKFSRFARDVLSSRTYKTLLAKHGIRVVSVHEDVADDPTGRLLEGVIEVMDQFYSENLAQEVRSGMVTNAKKGFRCGGMAPYGYRNIRVQDHSTGKKRTRLQEDPEESVVVRFLFQRTSEGATMGQIVKDFERRGWAPRRAKRWNKSALSQILVHEVYRGVLLWRKTKDPATWVRVPDAAPRLVDDETWNKVQKIMGARKRSPSNKAEGSAHPFVGMITCGHCGGPVGTNQKNQGKWRLGCINNGRRRGGCSNNRTFFEHRLVEEIRKNLVEHLFSPEAILDVLQRMSLESEDAKTEAEREIGKLSKELEKLERTRMAMLDELAAGDIARDLIVEKLRELEQRKRILLNSIEESRQAIDRNQIRKPTGVDVDTFRTILKARLEKADGIGIRHVLRQTGIRMVLFRDRLKIAATPEIFGGCAVYSSAGGPGLSYPARPWRHAIS